MSETLLELLPYIVKAIPYLARVLATAIGGGVSEDEYLWCLNVPGLQDVCTALRSNDASTVQVVRQVLNRDFSDLKVPDHG